LCLSNLQCALRLEEVTEDPKRVYIFTDARSEFENCVEDFYDLSREPWGRRFYSVVLECEVGKNLRRLMDEGRGKGNGKLTDPEVLLELRRTYEIWKFGGKDELVVDVTFRSPGEVAGVILDFVEGREVAGREKRLDRESLALS
jgi:hypothetical protein